MLPFIVLGYMIIAFDESSNDPKPIGHFVAPAGGQTRSCRGGSLVRLVSFHLHLSNI